jgi:hypothetical protein
LSCRIDSEHMQISTLKMHVAIVISLWLLAVNHRPSTLLDDHADLNGR